MGGLGGVVFVYVFGRLLFYSKRFVVNEDMFVNFK